MSCANPLNPAPKLAAACGLYCGACGVYLATREDPQRLAGIAARLGQSLEETRCEGCRADQRSKHCRSCDLAACCQDRGHAFCGECADYPCHAFATFQEALPHRRDIPQDMAAIVQEGAATWITHIPQRYTCPACSTLNGAYDLACRQCGNTPGSPFAADHGEALRSHLRKP